MSNIINVLNTWIFHSCHLRLLKDFKRINESLNINFKLLAEIKAEVSLQEDATTSEELLSCKGLT